MTRKSVQNPELPLLSLTLALFGKFQTLWLCNRENSGNRWPWLCSASSKDWDSAIGRIRKADDLDFGKIQSLWLCNRENSENQWSRLFRQVIKLVTLQSGELGEPITLILHGHFMYRNVSNSQIQKALCIIMYVLRI